MKKTKIVCSIGPASNEADVMEQMVLKGMNVARVNFTHATIEERTSILNSYTKDSETYKAINNYFHEPINSNLYSTYITEKIRKDIKVYVDKVYENFLKILKMQIVLIE